MNDKDTKFFDPSIPLILTKEAEPSSNLNDELLKIIHLIKNKHLKIENDDLSKKKSSFDNDLISIKNSARIINTKIKEKKFLINSIIENHEDEIQLLHKEKKLLNHNKIQSHIIHNLKILTDNLKYNNKALKLNINQLDKKLAESINSNKIFETNNNELNNNLNNQIITNEKLQDSINKLKSDHAKPSLNIEEIDEINNKLKFYQEENIRLSSELISLQNNHEVIKNNFNKSESEKNNIYKQIQELNNSLIKNNLVDTPFVKETIDNASINPKVSIDITNNNLHGVKDTSKQNNDLDDDITNIFN